MTRQIRQKYVEKKRFQYFKGLAIGTKWDFKPKIPELSDDTTYKVSYTYDKPLKLYIIIRRRIFAEFRYKMGHRSYICIRTKKIVTTPLHGT